MTIIRIKCPRDWRGNDPNDFRDDSHYLEKLEVLAATELARMEGKEPPAAEVLSGKFRYVGYKTIRRPGKASGGLVLEFAHTGTGEFAYLFFNVSLEGRKEYRTGFNGKFIPTEKGKFCTFWCRVFGELPRRLSRYNEKMRQLKPVEFTGTARRKMVGTKPTWRLYMEDLDP